MNKQDFNFELPEDLIAQYPEPVRSDSRLLVVPCDNEPRDAKFRDIVSLLNPQDLLVLNDSRVIHARFYAYKQTGGKVEVLIERIVTPQRAKAYLGFNRKSPVSTSLKAGDHTIHVVSCEDGCFELALDEPHQWEQLLESIGEVPLPPYMRRRPEAADEERYQTVYAKNDGSVAAPTAGLHFDKPLLTAVHDKGVSVAYLTLHIGGGTFQPLREESLDKHKMHSEHMVIDENLCEAVKACRERKGRVVTVGTTVLRALESAVVTGDGELAPCDCETDIFIKPGWRFRVADVLITNFHLPETTLFVLVCAFAGREQMLAAYRHAIDSKYRFFSYGDATWIERWDRTKKLNEELSRRRGV